MLYDKLVGCGNSPSCAQCTRYPVAVRLTACPLFKNVSTEQFTEMVSTVPHQIRSFAKGSMIAQANDECTALLIVLEGKVVGEMIDASGKSITIDEISAPNTLASAFVFGVDNRFPINITAKTEVQILSFAKNDLFFLLQKSSTLLQNYLFILSNQSQYLAQKIYFLNFKTIKGKIASYLMKMDLSATGVIHIPYTQQELADFFGVARQSLNRSFSEMDAEGIISQDRNKIRILKRKELIALLE